MNWVEFQIEKKAYEALWKNIVTEASGEMADFLKKSYLVVSCGQQFDMSDNVLAVAKACPIFFTNQDDVKNLLALDKEIQKLAPTLRRVARKDDEKLKLRRAEGQMKSLVKEMERLSSDLFKIAEGWRIEVRFPYIDIDLIQELKHSPYCDQELTIMRAYSINVVLKSVSFNENKNDDFLP